MTILMVTKLAPLPADSGGKLRSLAVLRRLAAIDRVLLCAFDDGRTDSDGLADLGVEVHLVPRPSGLFALARGTLATGSVGSGRFWDRRMAALISRLVRDESPRVAVIEYAQLSPYASSAPAPYRILDLHNIESALVASYASAAGPAKRMVVAVETKALRRIEHRAYEVFDTVAVVSEADRDRLPPGLRHVLVCPNGWEPTPPLPDATDPVAVFVGLLGWKPNEDAVLHLGRRIWPEVRRMLPEARLLVVGRDPAPAVTQLHGTAGIDVVGPVPDVRPWLRQARLALAPLRAGGGSRLKILEALEAGRPVVASPVGAEGLEHLAGSGLVIAQDDCAFARETARLLADGGTAATLGESGRRAVHAGYAWDVTLAPMVEAVQTATTGTIK